MVSRLPVFSGKTVRMRVPPGNGGCRLFVSVVFFIALLIGYPWYILSACTVLYLLSLPAGWKIVSRTMRAKAAARGGGAGSRRLAGIKRRLFAPPRRRKRRRDDRPARLN